MGLFRKAFSGVCLLLVWMAGYASFGAALPNVVMIMADDWGWSDIAAYRQHQVNVMGHDLSALGGTTPFPTPNIDRLCAEGMMFTDAYSAAGLCAPTRFSMMTGSNPYRNGRASGTWMIHNTSAFEAGRNHVTVGEIARTAGYRTAFFGKMHLGGGTMDGNEASLNYEAVMPDFLLNHGFDYTFVVHDGIQADPYLYMENDRFVKIDPSDPFNPSTPGKLTDTKFWTSGNYPGPNGTGIIQAGTDFHGIGDKHWDSSQNGIINSRKAAAFIDDHLANHSGQPFMMYYCAPQVHIPNSPPIDFEPNADGTAGSPPHVPVAGTTGGNNHSDILYELDLQVGWILNKLEDPNGDGNTSDSILTNTLFMFTSDNGGLGPKYAAAGYDSTGVLQGFKGSSFEGGHRVPFVACWPGMIASNSVSSQLIGGHDWVGIMYALTGNSMAANQAMDCVNLLPTLLGEQPGNVPLRDFMVLHRNAAPYVMRQGDYVLFLNASRVPTALYNLAVDLTQEQNLISEPSEQQRISDMKILFKQHDDQNDPRSTPAYIAPVVDTNPPLPNPAGFSVAPTARGASSAGMTAETGLDISGPVKYRFIENSGHEGGSSSGWQISPNYVDDKLLPGLTYSYSVQMRDAQGNAGVVSAAMDVTTASNGVVFSENFEAASNPANVAASPYPTGVWHQQGINNWSKEASDSSVSVGDFNAVPGNEMRIGYGFDEIVTVCSTTSPIDTNRTYTFSGRWELGSVLTDQHRGFIAGIAEFSALDGALVQRLTPDSLVFGNRSTPVLGESGTFNVTLAPAELVTAGVGPGNRIGMFFHHDDDGPLYDEGTGKNDVYLIDDILLRTDIDSMFEHWLLNYGVSGAYTDSDHDGAANFREFALGGNPTNPAHAGIPSTFGIVSNTFRYIYPRRRNSGLGYRLETCSNLLSNDWKNSGYTELAVAGNINADFEAVTNEVPVTNRQAFIRLEMDAQ